MRIYEHNFLTNAQFHKKVFHMTSYISPVRLHINNVITLKTTMEIYNDLDNTDIPSVLDDYKILIERSFINLNTIFEELYNKMNSYNKKYWTDIHNKTISVYNKHKHLLDQSTILFMNAICLDLAVGCPKITVYPTTNILTRFGEPLKSTIYIHVVPTTQEEMNKKTAYHAQICINHKEYEL